MNGFVSTCKTLAIAAFLIAISGLSAGAQALPPALTPTPAAAPVAEQMHVPFGVGERLDYEVKFKWWKVGSSVLEVHGIEDVRGYPSWHASLITKGRIVFFSVSNVLASWFDVSTLNSRRFVSDQNMTSYKKKRTIEIFPERLMFKEDQKEERPSVAQPLDDMSFFYFVRTIPLEVGKTYEFPRHYNPSSNPVRLTVTRRDTVQTPAGTFKTFVVVPTFRSGGLFGDGGKAEVWIADDSTRIMVQMKVSLKVGSLQLALTHFTPGAPRH